MKSIEAIIRAARADFDLNRPELLRISDAVKGHLIDALVPFAGSESRELRDLAAQVYERFCDGCAEEKQHGASEVEVTT